VLFAARLVTAAILVPPWQNPDEPVHFAVIRALTYNAWLDIANRRNVDVQAEILRSMAEHRWWSAYSEPVPDPLPSTFLGVPTHMGDAWTAPPLYYVAMAAYCRALRARGLLSQYYAVRLASAMMTLLTFALILRGAREWFGDTIAFYTGVLVALVPQFALIGISVSPDPPLFLLAAFVWWQAARLAGRKGTVVPVLLMSLATGVALLLKPLAIPLLAQLAALMLVAALFTPRGRLLVAIAGAAGVMLRLAGVLRAARWLSPEQLTVLHRYLTILGWGEFDTTPSYFADFSWRLFESAYLVAGWQRFYPPSWVVGTALAIFVVLLARGVLWAWVQPGDVRLRLAALAAVVFVAVQLAAIYGTKYYRPGWGAQGRFLFPAIGPFAALCALGLVHWRAHPSNTWIRPGVVTVMALLDLVSWMTTIVAVYGRWI
jgi:4-amino-4-deoxy-L-arabinose transferase-like glycosyltransferase